MFNNFTYPMKLDQGRLVSENEWSYGEVLFVIPPYSGCSGSIKWTGVYVNRTFTTMEDVRFSNPYPPKTTRLGNCGMRNKHDIQEASFNPVVSMDTSKLSKEALLVTRDWRCPFMYPKWKPPLDEVLSIPLGRI
ncbi:Disease resistance protein [Spatholobus suberectus]|nr:Disease resistance protein [Spatholobus suberectus]